MDFTSRHQFQVVRIVLVQRKGLIAKSTTRLYKSFSLNELIKKTYDDCGRDLVVRSTYEPIGSGSITVTNDFEWFIDGRWRLIADPRQSLDYAYPGSSYRFVLD